MGRALPSTRSASNIDFGGRGGTSAGGAQHDFKVFFKAGCNLTEATQPGSCWFNVSAYTLWEGSAVTTCVKYDISRAQAEQCKFLARCREVAVHFSEYHLPRYHIVRIKLAAQLRHRVARRPRGGVEEEAGRLPLHTLVLISRAFAPVYSRRSFDTHSTPIRHLIRRPFDTSK